MCSNHAYCIASLSVLLASFDLALARSGVISGHSKDGGHLFSLSGRKPSLRENMAGKYLKRSKSRVS